MSQQPSVTLPLGLTRLRANPAKLAGRSLDPSKNPFATQAKLLWHLDRLAEWRLTGDTFPVLMEINLTNHCNQGCPWCVSAYSHLSNSAMTAKEKAQHWAEARESASLAGRPERARGLEIPVLRRFLRQAAARGLRAVTWSGGGEPTTHPGFLEAVRAAEEAGLEQGLMTNGLCKPGCVPLIGNTLRWIRVSLDTIDPVAYERQRRSGGFSQVVANLRALVRYPVTLGVNLNLADWNFDEILSVAQWCRDEGLDYFQIRPVLGLPFEMSYNEEYRTSRQFEWSVLEPLLREAESYSTDTFQVVVSWDKFEDLRDPTGNFGRSYSRCLYHYFICVLNADGDLCVCMYHLGDKAFSFGNIYESTVDEIWGGEKRRQVVRMCAEHLDLATCQVCCKGHEINKLMHFIETPDPQTEIHFL